MKKEFECVECAGDGSGFPDYKIRKGGNGMEYWVLFPNTSEIEVTIYSGGKEIEKYLLVRESRGPEISDINDALSKLSISHDLYNSVLSTWSKKGGN